MRVTLSEDGIKRSSVKPGERKDLWDAAKSSRGLHLRITKTGGRRLERWRFLYRFEGRRQVWTFAEYPGTSIEEAQEKAEGFRQEVKEGRDPREAARRRLVEERAAREAKEAKARAHSLVSMVAGYVRSQRRKGLTPTSIRETIRQYKVEVFPIIPRNTPAAQVSPEEVDRIMARIVGRGSKSVADRVRSTLFSTFKWARRDRVWRHVVRENPIESVDRPLTREERLPRERVLSDDEVKALWLAAEPAEDGKADLPEGVLHPVIGAAFRLRLLSGQRWSEIVKAKWEHVATERVEVNGRSAEVVTWTIPKENTKGRTRTHVVPLSPQAVAVLEALSTGDRGYIFPALKGTGHLGTVGRSFRAWKKRAGVEDFIGKDIRRTCITGLSRLGVAPEVRQAVANHAPRGTTKKVYDKYDLLAEKLAALEKWGRHVDKLVTGETATVVDIASRR